MGVAIDVGEMKSGRSSVRKVTPAGMASRKPTRKASGLNDARRELEREAEEIRRKEQELKARLKKLPDEVQKRRLQRLSATTVAYGELHRRRSLREAEGSAVRGRLRKHRHSAKLQFLVLVMVLVLMLVLLWRVMPS